MEQPDNIAKEQCTSDASRAAHNRSGGLMSKLALIFVGLILVAITLSCVFSFVNTRITYLSTEGERLHEIGGYAASSIMVNESTTILDEYASWMENPDSIDETRTFAEESAYITQLADNLTAEVERLNAQETVSEEEEAAYRQLEAQYTQEYNTYAYYSMADMFDRLKQNFEVSSICLYEVDLAAGEATQIIEGVTADQVRGQDGVYSFGEKVSCKQDEYPTLWQTVQSGEIEGSIEPSPDGKYYLSYVPVMSNGDKTWVVETSIFSDNLRFSLFLNMLRSLGISLAVFAVCLVATLILLRRTMVRPLVNLDGRVRAFARQKDASIAGDIRADKFPHDEIGALANNTANMIDELQRHIDEVETMSAERERAQSELAVASRIQLSALPAVRPPFSGGDDFDLAASMHPAKEVGGDFYDFFLVDERHVAVVIADVSGKGVPAALFMMRAKALLRQLLSDGLSPEEAMAAANDNLCADNDAGMFVTVWMGVLDTTTGVLDYANGGHNPPLYRHADGTVEWLRDRSGLLLGSFEGMPYKPFSRTMKPFDTLLLYTDGVTEAMDVGNKCYGDQRLFDLMANMQTVSPGEVASRIEASVRAYAQGAEQADDLTLLALQFSGGIAGLASSAVDYREL